MKSSLRFLTLSWSLLLLLMTPACDPGLEPDPEPEAIEENHPIITLDTHSFYRMADADSAVLYVKALYDASYDIIIPDAAASWISTSTKHGTKSQFVGFRIADNNSGQDRSATIRFKYAKDEEHTVEIKQDARFRKDHYFGWGIEGNVVKVRRNDRPYTWYIDQKNTGTHSSNNCGPSCATMAVKWARRSHTKGAEYARSMFRPEGGWWYMSDITGFLHSENVRYRYVKLTGSDMLVSELDQGNIIIVCLDMNLLSYTADVSKRVDKFYTTTPDWGHFLVVYGYVKTDNRIFFEVCDPYSWGELYSDGTPKGYGRYYRGDELSRSVISWSTRVCIVEHP